MGYISKYDRTLVSFMNKKYFRFKVAFETFDDYIMWLYYVFCRCNEESYYMKLEKDIMEYSNFQTGSPREREKKLDHNALSRLEEDKYGLYKNDNYVEYLKRVEWKNAKN